MATSLDLRPVILLLHTIFAEVKLVGQPKSRGTSFIITNGWQYLSSSSSLSS
jgi:hypothetical protein